MKNGRVCVKGEKKSPKEILSIFFKFCEKNSEKNNLRNFKLFLISFCLSIAFFLNYTFAVALLLIFLLSIN